MRSKSEFDAVRKIMRNKPKAASLSKKMTLKGLYGFLIKAGKIAGGATFIFGIFYGIYQYYSAIQDKRIEQTLAMYRQFNLAPITDYRARIAKVEVKYREQRLKAAVDEKTLENTMLEIVSNEGLEPDLMLLMDFYDGLVACVSSSLCDQKIALDLFNPRATEVYRNFYQYIAVRRARSKTFGVALEKIALRKLKD